LKFDETALSEQKSINFSTDDFSSGMYYCALNAGTEKIKDKNILNVGETTSNYDLIKLYPNPFNDFINIDIEENLDNGINIEFYDLNGNKVLTQNSNNLKNASLNKILNTAELESGVYLVKISVNNKQFVYKLIKRN